MDQRATEMRKGSWAVRRQRGVGRKQEASEGGRGVGKGMVDRSG